MRKQDRIKASEQQRSPQQRSDESQQSDQSTQEQVKGSASSGQPAKPQRQPGKMPLPD